MSISVNGTVIVGGTTGDIRTSVDLSSAVGWTNQAGTGGPTSTINTTATQIELAVPSGVAIGQRFSLAFHDGYLDGVGMDVIMRIRAATLDVGSDDYIQLILIDTGNTIFLQARVDGASLVSASSSSGASTSRTVSGILGGSGWLRIVQIGGSALIYAGVGSGSSMPTSWTACGAVSISITSARLIRLRVGLTREKSGTVNATAEIGNITFSDSVI